MADRIDSAKHSEIMRRIGRSATQPEMVVRELVKRAGYRGYRFNLSSVLGKPDICWKGRKIAIFVHGCFWHGHNCRHGRRMPSSNKEYWKKKLARNVERDKQSQRALLRQGWHLLVIWECHLPHDKKVGRQIKQFMARHYDYGA